MNSLNNIKEKIQNINPNFSDELLELLADYILKYSLSFENNTTRYGTTNPGKYPPYIEHAMTIS